MLKISAQFKVAFRLPLIQDDVILFLRIGFFDSSSGLFMTGDFGTNSFNLREENPSFDQGRREAAQPMGEEAPVELIQVSGRIKWFDVAKGFGFIVPDN